MARFTREDGFTLMELLIVTAILGMVAAAIFGVYQVSQQIYIRSTSLEDAQLGARAGLDRMANELRLIGAYWTGASGAGAAITAAIPSSITFRGDVDGDGAGTTVATGTTASGTTVQVSGNASAFNTYSSATALNDFVYIAGGARREGRRISTVAGTAITLTTALTNTYPSAGSIVRSVETVTYTLTPASAASTTCPTPPVIAGTNCLTRTLGGGTAEAIVENVTGLTLTYYDGNGADLGAAPTLSSIQEIGISLTTRGTDGSRRTMTSRVRPRSLGFQ